MLNICYKKFSLYQHLFFSLSWKNMQLVMLQKTCKLLCAGFPWSYSVTSECYKELTLKNWEFSKNNSNSNDKIIRFNQIKLLKASFNDLLLIYKRWGGTMVGLFSSWYINKYIHFSVLMLFIWGSKSVSLLNTQRLWSVQIEEIEVGVC